MVAIITLSAMLQRSDISQEGDVQTSCAQVYTCATSAFMVAAQAMSFDHLPLVASRACIHETFKTITNAERFLSILPLSGHSAEGRLKRAPSIFVKVAYLLTLEL